MKIKAIGYGKDLEGDFLLIEIESSIIDEKYKEGDIGYRSWKRKEHKLYLSQSIIENKEEIIADWGFTGNKQTIMKKIK